MLSSNMWLGSLGNSTTLMISHSCLASRLVVGRESIQDTARHVGSMAVHLTYTHDSSVKYECAVSPILWMGI